MTAYFPLVPKMRYFNTVVTNVTTRVAFIDAVKKYSTMYYPYVVQDRDTAETIASKYYGSSSYDWLVYLANDIVDPYTQWPKHQLMFDDYIVKKYGSQQAARSQILFYRKDPVISYVSVDDGDFVTTSPPSLSYNQSENYEDIRITPESYTLIDNQVDFNPVYAYDYEVEENDAKRNIVLIGDAYASSIARELKDLLNGG